MVIFRPEMDLFVGRASDLDATPRDRSLGREDWDTVTVVGVTTGQRRRTVCVGYRLAHGMIVPPVEHSTTPDR